MPTDDSLGSLECWPSQLWLPLSVLAVAVAHHPTLTHRAHTHGCDAWNGGHSPCGSHEDEGTDVVNFSGWEGSWEAGAGGEARAARGHHWLRVYSQVIILKHDV